jgi:hypothetical protein
MCTAETKAVANPEHVHQPTRHARSLSYGAPFAFKTAENNTMLTPRFHVEELRETTEIEVACL